MQNILFLGDSLIGNFSLNSNSSFANKLVTDFNTKNKLSIEVLSIDGLSTSGLLSMINRVIKNKKVDTIFISIATNDLLQNININVTLENLNLIFKSILNNGINAYYLLPLNIDVEMANRVWGGSNENYSYYLDLRYDFISKLNSLSIINSVDVIDLEELKSKFINSSVLAKNSYSIFNDGIHFSKHFHSFLFIEFSKIIKEKFL